MAKKGFQSPKGTKDTLPEEQPYWQQVEEAVRNTVNRFGYKRLDLPMFEETALFQRGVGEGTDIVEKEMYTFLDKGGTSITLRPEFTAGTMRSYLENGMSSLPKPVKVWSLGPVFRYERPQAGRYRQHTQFNVEALGEQDPAVDVEVMSVAYHLYRSLGFRNLAFQINSIGCPVCRPGYLEKLKEYYTENLATVCEDCRKRLDTNPLRVLDCKQSRCQPVIEKAPAINRFLCQECDTHFHKLREYLDALDRPYQLNHRLVRGLDYYTKTVFEVWAQGIGAQNAVCGGGRYDKLAEVLGGPPTPAVGFASGMERLVLILKNEGIAVPETGKPAVFCAWQGEDAKDQTVQILSRFRDGGMNSVMGFGSRSLKAQLREANRLGVAYTVILGEEEVKTKQATVKSMESGTQESVPWEKLMDYFKNRGLGGA
jgi:histidyl-tRNA synthetase